MKFGVGGIELEESVSNLDAPISLLIYITKCSLNPTFHLPSRPPTTPAQHISANSTTHLYLRAISSAHTCLYTFVVCCSACIVAGTGGAEEHDGGSRRRGTNG